MKNTRKMNKLLLATMIASMITAPMGAMDAASASYPTLADHKALVAEYQNLLSSGSRTSVFASKTYADKQVEDLRVKYVECFNAYCVQDTPELTLLALLLPLNNAYNAFNDRLIAESVFNFLA